MGFLPTTTIRGGLAEHDELRQVAVECSQPVADPGPDRGKEPIVSVPARVKLELSAVVDVLRPDRTDQAEVVRAFTGVRPPVADLQPAFSPWTKTDLERKYRGPLLSFKVLKQVAFVFQKG